jgi:2-dehydropantoate 2-reductase
MSMVGHSGIERIAIVGSGAIGMYFGGRLAEHGNDVTFLMRGDAETARSRGIVAESVHGDFFLPHPQIAEDPENIGAVDLVIVAWKTTSNGLLGKVLPPLLHAQTVVLTLQNGLGNCESIAAVTGAERVMAGLCFIGVNRTGPARIHHSAGGRVVLAEFVPSLPHCAEAVQELFLMSKVEVVIESSMEEVIWKKLLWNIPFNGLAIAEGGKSTEALLSDAGIVERIRTLMKEVRSIAMARGFALEESMIDWHIERTRKMGAYRPSSLIDWQLGRMIEMESIWGEPLRRGKELGLELPELSRLYENIKHRCSDTV